MPPIQKHGGQPLLEKEAFTLKKGELSGVIQVGDTYVILFCEGRTEPIKTNFEEVKKFLYEDIHEKKLRIAMAKTFEQLKENGAHRQLTWPATSNCPRSRSAGRGGRRRASRRRRSTSAEPTVANLARSDCPSGNHGLPPAFVGRHARRHPKLGRQLAMFRDAWPGPFLFAARSGYPKGLRAKA